MADFVAAATATSQGTTSLTVPLPTGWAAGHLCFLEVSVNDGSVTITPPSGWTALDSAPVAVGSSQMSVWYRVLQSGDSNPQVGLASSFKCSGITSAYSSIDQGSPIAAVGTRGTRASSSTDTVAGSVTTTAADQTVVGFFMEKSSTSSSVTDPSGTTRRGVAFTTGGGAVSALTVDEVVASAGATGTRTAVYNVASSIGYGLLVAIEDGAPTPGSVTHAWVGAPTTDGFQVVAKLASATSVRLAVSTSSGMTSPVYTSSATPDADGYVRLTITGLSANTQYYWQLADTPSGGSESLIGNVGQAKTFPTGSASYTFAFAACQTNNNPDSEALDDIRAWGPLFFLHTGDLHYRDPSSTDPAVHRGYIEAQIVGAGGLAQLLREVPTNYTRSDHDTCGDNSDSNTDVGLASIAAYRQVVPHPPLADPGIESLHFSFVCGRVRFIVLDIRNYYRSTGADAQSSSKTMLGADQKQWLKDELLEPEPVKVIVSDVGWIGTASLSQGTDKWWSYDNERTEIGNYIVAQGIADRVVMLTGDNHALLSDDGTNNAWGGFPVWGAAPLANISGGRYLNQYQQKYSPDPQEDVRNYGRVTVTDAGTSITLTYSGWDALNGVERVDGELIVDTTVEGALAATLPAFDADATAIATASGDLAAGLPAFETSAAATATVSGQAAATLPSLNGTADATVTATGDFDANLPPLTADGQAVVTATSQVEAQLPALHASVASVLTVTGTADGVLPPLIADLANTVTVTGAVPAVLPALQAGVTGDVDGQSGILAAVLPTLGASAGGNIRVDGQIDSTLPALASQLAVTAGAHGAAATVLPAIQALVAGQALAHGSIAAALPLLTADVQSTATVDGVPDTILPALGVVLAGTAETAGGQLGAVLAPLAAGLTATARADGQTAAALPPLTASAAGAIAARAGLAAGLPALGAAVQGVVNIPTGIVTVTLPALAVAFAGQAVADTPDLAAGVGAPQTRWPVGQPVFSGDATS